MANIKTSDTLPDEALDELEAALNADFLPDDIAPTADQTLETAGEAEGRIEVETLSADTIDIDFAFTEFDRQIEEATGAFETAEVPLMEATTGAAIGAAAFAAAGRAGRAEALQSSAPVSGASAAWPRPLFSRS